MFGAKCKAVNFPRTCMWVWCRNQKKGSGARRQKIRSSADLPEHLTSGQNCWCWNFETTSRKQTEEKEETSLSQE